MQIDGRSGQINLNESARTITITRSGALIKPIWGNTPPYIIPLGAINDMHLQPATVFTHGYLSFGVNGSRAIRGNMVSAIVRDPNCVTFVHRQGGTFASLHARLTTLLQEAGPSARTSAGAAPAARGMVAKAARAVSGTEPLERLLDSILERADSAAGAGQARLTVSFNQADIGVRNTFDQAVAYLMTALEDNGLRVATVQGSGWDRTRVLVVELPSRGGASDLPAQLAQLASLRQGGDLSDEEFEAAKRRLLGS